MPDFNINVTIKTVSSVMGRPHQKVANFQPLTTPPGDIIVVVPSKDDLELMLHRKFYECVDESTFGIITDWSTASAGGAGDISPRLCNVSFVIEPGGRYLHAVSYSDVWNEASDDYTHNLIYRKYDIQEDVWGTEISLDTYINDSQTVGFEAPDIILDNRTHDDPQPIIVTQKKRLTLEDETWAHWKDYNGVWQSRQIRGEYDTNGAAGIVKIPDDGFFYITATHDSTSYLYQIPWMEWGGASMPAPNMWVSTAEVSIPDPSISAGNAPGTLGFVGLSSSQLVFRKYSGNTISEEEIISNLSAMTYGWGICYRNNIWRVFQGLQPTQGSELKYYERDDANEAWIDTTIPGSANPGTGLWSYLGITLQRDVPTPRTPHDFGCLMIDVTDDDQYQVQYIHIGEEWEQTLLPPIENAFFAFDIDDDKATLLSHNTNMNVMDVVRADDVLLFTNQVNLLQSAEHFKEWSAPDVYDNRACEVKLGAMGRANPYPKMCYEAVIDFTLATGATLLFYLINDEGDFWFQSLSADDSNKTIYPLLTGRYFIPMLVESSQAEFTFRSIHLVGKFHGARY